MLDRLDASFWIHVVALLGLLLPGFFSFCVLLIIKARYHTYIISRLDHLAQYGISRCHIAYLQGCSSNDIFNFTLLLSDLSSLLYIPRYKKKHIEKAFPDKGLIKLLHIYNYSLFVALIFIVIIFILKYFGYL